MQNDDDFYFVKALFYVTSGLTVMTSINFKLRISLLFFVRLSHNLVREICVVHVTLRSYKISCHLEGHIDLSGQWQGQCIFFLYCFIFRFIPPPILNWVTSNFQLWLLKKGTSSRRGIMSSISLNWNISNIYCRFEIKLIFSKSRSRMTFISLISLFCHFRSHRHDVIKLQLLISLLFYVRFLSQNLVRQIWVLHITSRSYISCDSDGHVDFWGQLQGKSIFFLFRLICRFITPSIHGRITLNC